MTCLGTGQKQVIFLLTFYILYIENYLLSILKLKNSKKRSPLQLQEVLIALSICSVTNPTVGKALTQLEKLKDCEAHSSHIITNGDLKKLKEFKIRLTCEPKFYADNIYQD